MAFFDAARGTVVARILYDGLGGAGKSTNVERVGAMFPHAVCGALRSPERSARGNTRWFDWLEVDAGYVGDFPLRCQVLSSPGQFARAGPRWRLLREADAVVLVADCRPRALAHARLAFRFARAALAGRAPPVTLILQANKQDLPDACAPEALRAHIGAPPGVAVVASSVAQGDGVRECFLRALAAARDRITAHLGGATTLPDGPAPPSADELRAVLQRAEPADEAEAALVLEALLAEVAP